MNETPFQTYVLIGAIIAFTILFIIRAMGKSSSKGGAKVIRNKDLRPLTLPPTEEKVDPKAIISPIKSELFGRIVSFDTASDELNNQMPINMRFIRPLEHSDGANYVLAALHKPLAHKGRLCSFLIVCGHFEGTRIARGMRGFPIKVAVVIDDSVVKDRVLDFSKVDYVAIGECDEITKDEMG